MELKYIQFKFLLPYSTKAIVSVCPSPSPPADNYSQPASWTVSILNYESSARRQLVIVNWGQAKRTESGGDIWTRDRRKF